MTMTESEARSKIKYRLGIARQIAGNGVDGKSFEEFEIALQALKEIRQYRELGTVEELKALKKKNDWHDMEMYGLGYNQGTIDRADELQKCREQGYNKAIDKFAERLKERLKGMQIVELQGEDVCPCSETGEECPYINQDIGCQYCAREQTIKDIDEIAEQMKGGATDERTGSD